MKIIDYIKGYRRGREANEIERQSLSDPFLSDALDGYETMKHENHFDRLIALRNAIAHRVERGKHQRLYRTVAVTTVGIAAAVAIGFGVWTILPIEENDSNVMQQAMMAELEGTTATVGTSEQLLAEAMTRDAYCDVVVLDYYSFVNSEPLSGYEQETAESVPVAVKNVSESAIAVLETEIDNLDTIANPAFVSYYRAHRNAVDGVEGYIVLEFRVNDSGKVAKIRILSAPTQETGREALNLLISGPAWQPTGDRRIRTVITL